MPNKTTGDLLREGIGTLTAQNVPDAAFDARCLLSDSLGIPLSALRLHLSDAAAAETLARFSARIARRAAGEPLQYILGEWDFYDLTFTVRPGVLIPRPETEFLVRQAIGLLPQGGVLYDVCAGTGCIGICAAYHRPDAEVYLFEKYAQALSVLQENTERYALQNVHVVPCDMLCGVPDGLPAPDGIVSNPPYIPSAVLPTLQKEVRQEPATALDGGEDGLVFYRALRDLWFPLLPTGAFISMECGEEQPLQVSRMFSGAVRTDADFAGTPRFVTAIRE